MKGKNMIKVIEDISQHVLSVLLAIAMTITSLTLPQNVENVYAEDNQTVNNPSSAAFWTNDDLKNLITDIGLGTSFRSPYYVDEEKTLLETKWAGKSYFVIGYQKVDNTDTLVLLSERISEQAIKYSDEEKYKYEDSYIYKVLNGTLDEIDEEDQSLNFNRWCHEAKTYIKPVKVDGVENCYLYSPKSTASYADNNASFWCGVSYTEGAEYLIYVRGETISFETNLNKQKEIWLRNALNNPGTTSSSVLNIDTNRSNSYGFEAEFPIVYTFNFDISCGTFASIAQIAQSDGIKTLDSSNTMIFRITDPAQIKSTVKYSGSGSKVTVTKSKVDKNDVYLCVQYNDGSADKLYSKKITESCQVDLSDIGDLTNAKIWVEMRAYETYVNFASYSDSIVYASYASNFEEDCECSQENPHEISTTADLDNIRNHIHTDENGIKSIDGYFKLVNDIEFSTSDFEEGGTYYNSGIGWIPIGENLYSPEMIGSSFFYGDIELCDKIDFVGTLDGNGHTISNIKTYAKEGLISSGLFDNLGKNSYVHDLILNKFCIEGAGASVLATEMNYNKVENIVISKSSINLKFCGVCFTTVLFELYGGIFASYCNRTIANNITISECSAGSSQGSELLFGLFACYCEDATFKDITLKDCKVDTTPFLSCHFLGVTGGNTKFDGVKVDNLTMIASDLGITPFTIYENNNIDENASISNVSIEGKIIIPESAKFNMDKHNVYLSEYYESFDGEYNNIYCDYEILNEADEEYKNEYQYWIYDGNIYVVENSEDNSEHNNLVLTPSNQQFLCYLNGGAVVSSSGSRTEFCEVEKKVTI